MKRSRVQVLAFVAAVFLAAPAHAITLNFQVDVTKAVGGNPIGAVVGTGIAAGSGNTGTTTPAAVGPDSVSFQPSNSGVGAFLSLLLGTEIFDENDDLEGVAFNDIPSAEFLNGVFTGLDFAVLFEMVAGDPVSKQFTETDLGQDTSEFTDTPHYALDFFDEPGSNFSLGLVTGFAVVFDPDEGETGLNVLRPVFGQGTSVEGHLVPEPGASALLLCMGIALAGVLGRRK